MISRFKVNECLLLVLVSHQQRTNNFLQDVGSQSNNDFLVKKSIRSIPKTWKITACLRIDDVVVKC